MQTEQPRRDNLYYAANLIGLAVLVYLAVSALRRPRWRRCWPRCPPFPRGARRWQTAR